MNSIAYQGELDVVSRSGISYSSLDNVVPTFIAVGPNTNVFKQFGESVNPIDWDEWNNGNILEKIFCIIKIPGLFFLLLVIPIVDYEVNLHGWSKLLNSIQVFLLPTVSFYMSVDSKYKFILGY